MSDKSMFVPRATALKMFGDFLISKKYKHFHHLSRLGRVYTEYSISSLIRLSETFKQQVPNLKGIKIYFVSDPQNQQGQAVIQLLVCPVVETDVADTYVLLDKYETLVGIGNPDPFSNSRMTTVEAKPWSFKYRNEFARKPDSMRNGVEDTRSVFYEITSWQWFIDFLKLLLDIKLKAYLVTDQEGRGGLIILFTLQKNGEDIFVESLDDFPADIFISGKAPKFGILSFDTGNPCPPGSGGVPNECRGNGLEP